MTSSDTSNGFNHKEYREKLEEEFQPNWNKLVKQLEAHAVVAVKAWELESEQVSAMWAEADQLGIGGKITQQHVEDYLSAARCSAQDDTHWVQGQAWNIDADFDWIWEGWIAEGFLHVVTALPKVGKSTLVLALFAELEKRTGSFLNFPISKGKKHEVFLVGPDMNRFLWNKAGIDAGLLDNVSGIEPKWKPIVREIWAEEDQAGLTPEFIKTLATKAQESIERGASPIFFFDSYKKLLFFAGDDADTGSSKFAKRLNMLRSAMTEVGKRTGKMPTSIVLNHASLSSSKRSASLATGGDQTFSGIPDQCISLNWCSGIDSAVRTDKRVVLTAEGRTGVVMPAALIEQYDAGKWMTHGEAGDAEDLAKALDERDRLNADHAAVYDIINGRTHNNQPTTRQQISDIRETQTGGRSGWSLPKINRSVQFLKRRKLIVEAGTQQTPGDLGGRPSVLWYSFERELVSGLNPIKPSSEELNREEEPSHTRVNSVKSLNSGVYEHGVEKPKQIVPCWPVGETVKVDGVGGWEVVEANLASGLHVIEKNGLSKKNLRKMDLSLDIDYNEEL